MDSAAVLAQHLYTALATGDGPALDALLAPDFRGVLADGMPFGIGGEHDGPDAMRRNGWGAIGRHFAAHAEPERFLPLADGRLLVTGRYTGTGRHGGTPLDAGFAHLITVTDGRIRALEQYTDTARWTDAAAPTPESASDSAAPFTTLTLDVADGIATVRLDRPDQHNAIDVAMARDLSELATRLAEDPSVRVVLLLGNGPMLTAGGDVRLRGADTRARKRLRGADTRARKRLRGTDTRARKRLRGALHHPHPRRRRRHRHRPPRPSRPAQRHRRRDGPRPVRTGHPAGRGPVGAGGAAARQRADAHRGR
ncbi:nuclear transport factor 2 family protein [Pseudonocardia sp. 73-21]|uniref:nuclear transport factor 2 family protein n=1 Tax=Pseudonocardia sp. 73-21 TaxID=1895809 RepID=UPI0026395EBE|nr:nuclear transport factor 2 family protein [Pseudonocardia sp. 73-21]